MGMCLALHSVSDKNIGRILEFPPLIWRLLAPESPELYEEAVNSAHNQGFWAKLFAKKSAEKAPITDLEFIEGENIEEDLDKSWHGIHYCLNKTNYDATPPLDFITSGGEQAGEIDVGYGQARFFRSTTVKDIHRLINNITAEEIRASYNPSEMHKLDIYPDFWERDEETSFEYISENFELLKTFISSCVKHNLGMAVYLC